MDMATEKLYSVQTGHCRDHQDVTCALDQSQASVGRQEGPAG